MKSLLLLSGFLFVHIGMLSLFSTVKADENVSGKSPEELPESMVYFIGSVEQVLESRAIFDLGDAHSLREGDVVTVFRSRDNEYQPLGTLEVRESFPTWSVSLPTKKFVAETGDIVVFVRAVGEIGTPRAIQARFLADQKISNRNRNSYSTVRNDVVARALTKVQRGQPGWVQFRKTISGTVYSESLGSNPSSNLRRLTDQIDLLRMLDQSGLPASDAASDRWMIVMKQLSTRSAKSESVVVQEADNAAAKLPLRDVRAAVEDRLFEGNPEQQALASALVASLLRYEQRNETAWLERHLRLSQFPELAGDEQFVIDMTAVIRELRESAGQ